MSKEIKVKQIYTTHEDDDGHTYLIPIDKEDEFLDKFRKLENRLESYILSTPYEFQDDELVYEYQQEIYSLFDGYTRLEGERHYVVLEDDII